MSDSKKVLFVEDQQALQQLMLFELTDMGHRVVAADNGLEALEQLEQQSFDVIVTDLFMPEMGGIELIEVVKKSHPELPIIVLSASRHHDVKEQLTVLGVPHFIDKPITADKISLLNHLIEAL